MSLTIVSPTSDPPVTKDATEPGRQFRSNTCAIIFVVAIEVNGVVGAPFQTTVSPHTIAIAAFQPYTLNNISLLNWSYCFFIKFTCYFIIVLTATGKLNAEITPTTPTGFHCSRII